MKIIRTEEDYDLALARLDEIFDAKPDTPDGDELEVLSLLLEKYEKEHHAIELPSPIEAIKFRMEQAGLRQADLIPYIGSSAKVSEVLSGKRSLTISMMKALHRDFGIPAEVFLGVNADVKVASFGDPGRLPWAEMVKRGWLRDFTGTVAEAKADAHNLVAKLFHPSAQKCLEPALYRRSIRSKSPMDDAAVTAWTARVITLACDKATPTKFQRKAMDKSFTEPLVKLSFLDNGPFLAQEYLLKHGIHLVFEKHLPKTKIDGAATMLPDGTPVIGLSLRFDRLDNFWFNLFHELGHIALHFDDDDVLFVDDFSSESKDIELEADEWGKEALIPTSVWKSAGPLTNEASVKRFAQSLGITPAIVAGRLRFERQNYRILTDLVGSGEVRKHFENM
ncbi:ImmA/IrrE family metallo-endopeptidase [Rhizobium sp.]|jgi:HTH-type transcriptional regulator / antitoxin HigA|uniref:ImmA/IrrE family metallo-endopeptidase n=1 Tax=Rhizobium sp. TaxID=391 RepID=UPI000E99D265|nr:hypothetical protein [Rhizobium sp.]